jgi:hypothetical protein
MQGGDAPQRQPRSLAKRKQRGLRAINTQDALALRQKTALGCGPISSRNIHALFQPFLLEKSHGYCVSPI